MGDIRTPSPPSPPGKPTTKTTTRTPRTTTTTTAQSTTGTGRSDHTRWGRPRRGRRPRGTRHPHLNLCCQGVYATIEATTFPPYAAATGSDEVATPARSRYGVRARRSGSFRGKTSRTHLPLLVSKGAEGKGRGVMWTILMAMAAGTAVTKVLWPSCRRCQRVSYSCRGYALPYRRPVRLAVSELGFNGSR